MDTEKIIALIEGYGAGTLTPGEETAFLQWYSTAGLEEFHTLLAQCQHLPSQLAWYPDMPAELRARLEEDIRKVVVAEQGGEDRVFAEQDSGDIAVAEQEVAERYAPRRRIPLVRPWWAAAAAIILLLGGWYFQMHRPQATQLATERKDIGGDVAPGTTRAVLTLADGTRITLDSARNGQLAMQGKTTISHQDGAITYNGKTTGELIYNTLATTAGEQSPPLTLSDGTRVWLNAASSIRYPVDFAGDTRTVTVTGEAYFEVAKDAAKPFYVQVKDLTVAVLGTDFNINAYADEPAIRTTLLAGSVKVLLPGGDRLLFPGQQDQAAVGTDKGNPTVTGTDAVTTVDVDQVMAWKNGLFNFDHADLPTVLRQLARWYDIDVKFEDGGPARTFHGKITRDLKLSQVLAVLQEVGVKFRLEGRTLTVQQ